MCNVEMFTRQLDRERKARKQAESLLEQRSRELYDTNQELQRTIEALEKDVAERVRVEATLRKVSRAVEQSPATVVITDRDGCIEYVNPKFVQLTGYASDEVIGQNPRVLKSGRMSSEIYEQLWQTILEGKEWRGELLNRKKSGELYWEFASISPITDTERQITHFVAVKEDISERKRAEDELAQLNRKLVETSRLAGMAEVATSVLHNVGNVLNSINVSSNLVAEKLRRAGIADFRKAADLIEQNREDLGTYVTQDERGQHLGTFLIELSRHMADTEESISAELRSLQKNIEHVKDIVALQQSHTGVSGLTEKITLREIVEDAIRVNIASIERHGLTVERDFDELPPVVIDKQKVLQILINLISNAKYALIDRACRPGETKRITICVRRSEPDRIVVAVEDNGVGIPQENLTGIFQHGFTTKKTGHGFGLHSAALHAEDLGGELLVQSDGPGTGATFSLELPFQTTTECQTAELATASV